MSPVVNACAPSCVSRPRLPERGWPTLLTSTVWRLRCKCERWREDGWRRGREAASRPSASRRTARCGGRVGLAQRWLSALCSYCEFLSNLFSSNPIIPPPPRRCERETARARRPLRLFSTSSPPIAEVPHETGVSCFVEVSKDSSRRESVRTFERAHCPPAPLIGRIAATRGSNFDANTRF